MKPEKDTTRLSFPAIGWAKVEGGGAAGRMKKFALQDGGIVRILEIRPNWNETDWCRRSHTRYVLSGRLRLDFETGEPVGVRKGEGFSIAEGRAHKASCRRVTRMFIVG